MRGNASISEPFVLSTYGTSQKLQKSGKLKKGGSAASVFATHGQASGSSEGYATVTAQADGIHVLDISTLHPVISHTLGPSTTFCCPAVTRNSREGTNNMLTTYAAIESSSDISGEKSGRTIWMWKENLSSRLVDRDPQKKQSVILPHEVSGLYICDDIPTRLLAQSYKADVTILDAELNVKGTWRPSYSTQSIIRTFVYPRTSCSFVPPQSVPLQGAIVIMAVPSGMETRVLILSVDDADNFLELGDCPVPLDSEQITDISCSITGNISIMARDGTWHSRLLESTDGNSVTMSHVAEPFRLKGLSFISKHPKSQDISLLSTTSSHVLLSAFTSSPAPEIVLLLWDLQYSVLLASYSLPVPPTLLQSKDAPIKLSLVSATTSQALLVLSPHTSNSGRKSQTTSRSNVLVLPFLSPPTSTIANAMGQATTGAKWVDQRTAPTSGPLPQPHDPARTKLLVAMRAAMEKNLPQAANLAFFEWERRESKKAATKFSGPVAPSSTWNKTSEHHPVMSYAFVRDLLTTVIQPSKPANTPYSSDIVRYLLNRQMISGNMVEGGLLTALRYRSDWQSINLALANVPDLSEEEIIDCLHLVISRHRRTTSQGPDSMQVDSVSDLPSLPHFLSSCVAYTTTPAALRSAIRRTFHDADEILSVLEVLETWVGKWSSLDVKLLPSRRDMTKNEHGIPIFKVMEEEINPDLPPLNKVLDFLQTLLDASFLTMLTHPPSHSVLRNIRSHVEPQIAYNDYLEQFRGPFEPFARAHVRAIEEGGQDKRKKPVMDWRLRRKQAHELAELSLGPYQVEELVL